MLGEEQEEEEAVDAATGTPLSTREVEALLGGQGAAGAASLLGGREQEDEEQEWGLEELEQQRSQVRRCSS